MAYNEEALARYMLETGKVPQEGEVFFSSAGELYETQSEEGLEAMRAELELLDYEEKKKRLGSKQLSRQRGWEPSMEGAGTIDERRAPRVPEEPPLTLGKIARAMLIGSTTEEGLPVPGALGVIPAVRAAQGARAVASSIPRGAVTKAGELYRYLRGRPIPEPRTPPPEYHVPPRSNRPQATRRKKAEPDPYRPSKETEDIHLHDRPSSGTFKKGGLAHKKNIDGRAIQGKTKTKYF